jgi:hypothetical protein
MLTSCVNSSTGKESNYCKINKRKGLLPIRSKCLDTDKPRDTENTCLQIDDNNYLYKMLCN